MEFLYECYRHNIYLLFLPAHSSHVLQPLDVAVFSSIKAFYCKELGNRSCDDDSTPVGERVFLECYAIVRESGLSDSNIRAGWRRSGLWPVTSAKPLMNKLLLNPVPTTPKTTPSEPKLALDKGLPEVKTLSNKYQLRRLFSDSTNPATSRRTIKLIQRKIEKQFNSQRAQLVLSNQENMKLKASNQISIQKRKKVNTDPNSVFVQIIDVENTRSQLTTNLQGN